MAVTAQERKLLLDGEWIETGEWHEVRSPYSGETVARVPQAGADHARRAVDAAAKAMENPLPAHHRAEILDRVATLLRERQDDVAQTICAEAAKPLKAARVEAERAVSTFTMAAVEARRLAGAMVPMDASPAGVGKLAFTLRRPIGVVGAISPFNFPLNLVAHKLAPALAAGCAVVLKPASQTPLSALLLAELETEAGLPPGWLNVLVGPASELGNATPVIVHGDAELEEAAEKLAQNAFSFAGQSCISVQRVYVQRWVYEDFVSRFVPKVESLVLGDPADEETDVGPVIDDDARERILSWIEEARDAGAEILAGGGPEGDLIQPTVIANATLDMKVCREEVFGPVCVVNSYESLDEAIALANGTRYGLQAGIFTADIRAALQAAQKLEFGGVTVNEAPTFRADQMPYGGVKDSGNTREGPAYAVREMTEERVVVIEL